MADLTLAIAGHAPNSARNVESLLADWLDLGAPDEDGYYDKPDRYKNITVYALLTEGTVPAGLKPALKVLPYIDGVTFEIFTDAVKGDVAKWSASADQTHEVDDPYPALISALGDARGARLLVNWDERDADDERLVKLAHEHGKIRVLDLVEGLVEIVPDEAEPEPEPVEESAPTRRRTRTESRELDEQPEELDDTPAVPEPVKEAKTAPESAVQEPTQLTMPAEDTLTVSRELAEMWYGALVVAADHSNYLDCIDAIRAGKSTEKTERSALTQELTNSAELLRAVLFGEVPYSVAASDKPKSAPAGKPVKVIWDEDAKEWKRAGRGRVRAGSRIGMMDEQGNVVEAA